MIKKLLFPWRYLRLMWLQDQISIHDEAIGDLMRLQHQQRERGTSPRLDAEYAAHGSALAWLVPRAAHGLETEDDMSWSKELPTEPGWYWLRPGRCTARVVETWRGEDRFGVKGLLTTDNVELPVLVSEYFGSLWCRVLTPEQETALRIELALAQQRQAIPSTEEF